MWNLKWLIAAFAILSFAQTSLCASTTKQNEDHLEISEQPKPDGIVDAVSTPAPEPLRPAEPSEPAFVPALIPADSNLSQLLNPPRRVITYDQRQEGKYNIRADLENFMIVLIPSSPSSGSSLLDLLTRSAQQKSKAATTSKNHKKYHGPTVAKHADKVHSQPDDAITNKLNNLHQAAAAKSQFLQLQASAALAAEQARRNQPFIEGRTPYHVDISSSELGAADLHKQQQQHDDSPLFRMLRPLLQQHIAQRRSADHDTKNRNSKSLSDASSNPRPDLINNSVVLAVGPLNQEYFENQHRSFGSDYVDLSSSYDFVSNRDDSSGISGADSIDRLAAGESSKSGASSDGWDQLTLLGAQEQCGPDRRRDSYGICQFVPLE